MKVTVIQYLSHSVGEPEWHKSTFVFMDELIRIENVKLLCFLLFTVVDGGTSTTATTLPPAVFTCVNKSWLSASFLLLW